MRYFLQMGYFSLENDRNQEVRLQNLKAKIVNIFLLKFKISSNIFLQMFGCFLKIGQQLIFYSLLLKENAIACNLHFTHSLFS